MSVPASRMVRWYVSISDLSLLADRLKFSQLFFDDEHRNSEVESLGMFLFDRTPTRDTSSRRLKADVPQQASPSASFETVWTCRHLRRVSRSGAVDIL